MKTNLSACSVILTVAALFAVLSSGCKKEKDPVPAPPATDQQRLSSIRSSYDDSFFLLTTCNYEGSRLASLIVAEDSVVEYEKLAVAYTGDLLSSVTCFEKDGSQWKPSERIDVMGYSGSDPLEIQDRFYSDNGGDYVSKRLFFYENSLLRRTDDFHQNGSNWISSGSVTYEYDGQNRILRTVDTMGYYGYITTYRYEGSKMVSWKKQYNLSGSFADYLSTEFTYNGDQLTAITQYIAESGIWQKASDWTYTYNDHGNVTSEHIRIYGSVSYTWIAEYFYEQGQGNFRTVARILSDEVFLPGDPMPMPVRPAFTRTEFPSRATNPR